MTLEESARFVGQRRMWLLEYRERPPTEVIVTCTHVEGRAVIDKNGLSAPCQMVYCEYDDRGCKDKVGFLPERFEAMRPVGKNGDGA